MSPRRPVRPGRPAPVPPPSVADALALILARGLDLRITLHDPTADRTLSVLEQLLPRLTRIDTRTKEMHMALTEMNATLKAIDEATNNIAADIAGLKITTGMSQADVDAVQAKLDAAAARLQSLAASTDDPVPALPV